MKRRKEFKHYLPLVFIAVLSIQFGYSLAAVPRDEKRCGTLDIRNHPTWNLRANDNGTNTTTVVKPNGIHNNCTVLEGSFFLSMIASVNFSHEVFPRYENIVEITGSLLVFNVVGLRSLGQVFPNLRIIGGHNLVQSYSLIIYQNPDLREIGLPHLSLIRNGGVRIAENPLLCYARFIDWPHLLAGNINDILVDDSIEVGVGEGQTAFCSDDCAYEGQKCRKVSPKKSKKTGQMVTSCWNGASCQIDCTYDVDVVANRSVGPGCADSDGSKCHAQCARGCTVPNDPYACYGCLHVKYKGECTNKCPDGTFTYLNRRCVTKKECDNLTPPTSLSPWKAYDGICSSTCPDGYEEDANNRKICKKCEKQCDIKCPGNYTVDNVIKAQALRRCTVIEGYLEIEIRHSMDKVAPEQFAEMFTNIVTIEGYLVIRLSPSFTNLYMFKNLRHIKGITRYRNLYALSVFDNNNLQKLFEHPELMKVHKGLIEFQNNRQLCYAQIGEFMEGIGRPKELDSEKDSNGDRAICERVEFNIKVEQAGSNSLLIKWIKFNFTDTDDRKFLGYQIFHKKVDSIDPNMTIDDNRSACSDSWDTHFEESKRFTDPDNETMNIEMATINDLEPNTLYAVYVQSQTVRHQGAKTFISRISWNRTNFGPPDPPVLTLVEPDSPTSIKLAWNPPERPNGIIDHYIVRYRLSVESVEQAGRKQCSREELILHSRREQAEKEILAAADEPSTTMASVLSTLMGGSSSSNTCSRYKCCECKVPPTQKIEQSSEKAAFENNIQDMIFVQHRKKRNISDNKLDAKVSKKSEKNEKVVEEVTEKEKSTPLEVPKKKEKESNSDYVESVAAMVEQAETRESEGLQTKNTTKLTYHLTNLTHFGSYFISIMACQNTTGNDNHCSSAFKAWKYVRTKAIPERDIVLNSTIVWEVMNGTTNDIRIHWKAPERPNGIILEYYVKVVNMAKQAIERCVPADENTSVIFEGMHDGEYRVEIRATSLHSLSAISSPWKTFVISTPGFWNAQTISIALIILVVFAGCIGFVGYYFVDKVYTKKVKEHAAQIISANPEYLSQNDVYKPDQWELTRSDLTMEDEIGRGTFGKVFRGFGHDVKSQCGETFGPCAIKTVAEGANSAERLHFLLEASVMKGFISSFIVKLYGVVSDGQPVLVVMEMMEKGNLRDFLRSRRPGAEENTENLPVPHANQYYEWAAQIADGMAYLESIRFCHRDLAARNCMVRADETVKIGDFGMARDLYYHEYYKPTGKRLMPVRWMAPESLKDGKFDMKSDVWSFGIVLYEMLTLGQQPYMGLANDEVLSFIGMSRKVLEKPKDCPDFWYDLMVNCWKYSPRERPNFVNIVHYLMDYTSDIFKTMSFVSNHAAELEANEPVYVPEGHGMRLETDIQDPIMEDGVCASNRAESEEPYWGEGESFAAGDVEDEL